MDEILDSVKELVNKEVETLSLDNVLTGTQIKNNFMTLAEFNRHTDNISFASCLTTDTAKDSKCIEMLFYTKEQWAVNLETGEKKLTMPPVRIEFKLYEANMEEYLGNISDYA